MCPVAGPEIVVFDREGVGLKCLLQLAQRTNAATVSEKLWIPSFHNLVVGTECIQC